MAQLSSALHLGDGIVQVIELQAGQWEEPIRRLLAVIRRPVVIGRKGRLEDVQVLRGCLKSLLSGSKLS
jgi:hypothetical protein